MQQALPYLEALRQQHKHKYLAAVLELLSLHVSLELLVNSIDFADLLSKAVHASRCVQDAACVLLVFETRRMACHHQLQQCF